jgi:hypothetical protein
MKVGQIVMLSQPEHITEPGGKSRYRLHGSPAIVTRLFEDGSANLTVIRGWRPHLSSLTSRPFSEVQQRRRSGLISYVEDSA